MNTVVLPFLMSLMLGRTIDLRTYKLGGDVFDSLDYTETPINQLNSTFTVLHESSFPYSYIGMPADLVLRVKTNNLASVSDSMGLDGLLKDTSIKSRQSVVVAVVTLAQTVHRNLRQNASTINGWTERVSRDQTHYVSSVVYGGWSVIFIKYECNAAEDEYIVRDVLTEHLGRAGLMNEETVERWNTANLILKKNKELSGKLKVTTSRYSSVRLSPDLSTPKKLLELIHKFIDNVGTLGRPLFAQLKPLSELDSRYPLVKENRLIDRELEIINEQLDDLKLTSNNMRHWLSNSIADFTGKEEKTISDLFTYMKNCTKMFSNMALEVSVFSTMRVSMLKAAIRTYESGLKDGAPTYQMLFRRLKEDLDPQCTDHFGYKIKGLLDVSPEEQMHLGQLKNGLRGCRTHCIAEPKCRAVGYAVEYISQEFKNGELVNVYKYKQCFLYFRSSNTATLKRSTEHDMQVYNRNCY